MVTLTEALCRFFDMQSDQGGDTDDGSNGIPESVLTEWSEFFVPSLFPTLLPAFVKLAGNSNAARLARNAPLLEALSDVLGEFMPVELLLEHELEPKFLVEDLDCDGRFEDKVLFLLNHVCPLLLSADRNVQRCAHKLLTRYGMTSLPQSPR